MFRREARDIILRNVHASKDDVAFFAGTGTTGGMLIHHSYQLINLIT
jgi:hypothetical protein